MSSFLPTHLSNLEAEISLLGAMALGGITQIDQAGQTITASDFSLERHSLIFDAMVSTASLGTFDIVALKTLLESRKQLETIGGMAYLMQIFEFTPTVVNLPFYASAVRECSEKRRLLSVTQEIADMVREDTETDASTLKQRAETLLFALSAKNTIAQAKPLPLLMQEQLDVIEERGVNHDGVTGVTTGLRSLDAWTCGWQKGELIIIGARPKVGKSLFALNLAINAALAGHPVLFFSLEMFGGSVADRALSNMATIDASNIRRGLLSTAEWSRASETTSDLKFADFPLDIIDTRTLTPALMRSAARRFAKERGHVGLIVLDYIGLMDSGIKNFDQSENQTLKLSYISRDLKKMAQDFDCPILCLAQLNREGADKPPSAHHIRNSGSQEQDADAVILLHREGVEKETPAPALPPDLPNQPQEKEKAASGIVLDVIIALQRNGPAGICKVTLEPTLQKISDWIDPQEGLDESDF
jgi:replicative DNA helicase